MGGLGNQLFQYAFAKEIAFRRGTQVTMDLGWFAQPFRRSPAGLILRKYELSGLDDSLTEAEPKSLAKAELAHASWWARRQIANRRSGRCAGLSVETSTGFEPSLLSAEAGPDFWGYFASWRYFESVSDEVRTCVITWISQSDEAARLVARAKRDQPIGIHVRRGDYVGLAEIYGELRADYYQAAINRLRKTGLTGPVWLFSDDPADAKRVIGEGVAVDYTVGSAGSLSTKATLAIMSAVAGLVIANSTFSWWGAFLGGLEADQVVTPETYLRSQGIAQSHDFYCPGWVDLYGDGSTPN